MEMKYFRNPSQQQILGLHFEMATPGQLRYLNVNTTLNSSVLLNYRQTEAAFWSEYLPTVIGAMFPIYRPYSEVLTVVSQRHSKFLFLSLTVAERNWHILFILAQQFLDSRQKKIIMLLLIPSLLYNTFEAHLRSC